jgi:rubredoxin
MKTYSFYCDNCSFKKNIKSNEDLNIFKIVKSAPIQKNLPTIDPITNKFKDFTERELPKKIKCPKCGFTSRPKIIKEIENDKPN